jgi:hypothetical protein
MATNRKPVPQPQQEVYKPPKPEFFFYVGAKYYYRLSPIPYAYKPPDFDALKKLLEELKQ